MKFLSILWNMLKVFLLFVGCTLLFYYSIVWISQEYENFHRYDEPKGRAMKVVKMEEESNVSLLDRLLFYYYFGE